MKTREHAIGVCSYDEWGVALGLQGSSQRAMIQNNRQETFHANSMGFGCLSGERGLHLDGGASTRLGTVISIQKRQFGGAFSPGWWAGPHGAGICRQTRRPMG
jgi:hypothetical protein